MDVGKSANEVNFQLVIGDHVSRFATSAVAVLKELSADAFFFSNSLLTGTLQNCEHLTISSNY